MISGHVTEYPHVPEGGGCINIFTYLWDRTNLVA